MIDSVAFHDGKMHGVAGRQVPMPQHNLFRTFGDGPIHGHYLIDDAEQRVECGLDGVAAIKRDVSMKNLL